MNFIKEVANEIATNNTISSINHTSVFENAPTITAEYLVQQIGDFTKYQLLNNVHTAQRLSAKGIFQLFSNMVLPKTLSSQLRKHLEEQGLTSSANGNIPFFKISKSDEALVNFARFDGDSFIVPKLDVNTIEQPFQEMYQTLFSKDNQEKKSSIWVDKMDELGLSEVEINKDGSNISIVGEAIENLDDILIDFPPITDLLPTGAYLINYEGSPRIYVKNRLALKHTLQNIPLMSVDAGAYFYQPFEGGIWTKEELDNNQANIPVYPECENIHKESYFTGGGGDLWFEINTAVAYIYSLKTGVYQKYSNLRELNGKDFFIMRHDLREGPERTEDDIKNALENIFVYLESINDDKTLEFIRKDLKNHTPISFEKYIDDTIGSKLSQLN